MGVAAEMTLGCLTERLRGVGKVEFYLQNTMEAEVVS